MIKNILLLLSLCTIPRMAFAKEQKAFCVAHRGNSSVELENSEASILSAAELGVGAVEFDIQHTQDGVAIINHDKNLERVTLPDPNCQAKTPISELLFKNLEECRLKNGEHIPLFSDIARELKSYPIKLFIEYKSEPTLREMQLLSELYSDQPERIVFISFKEKFLDKIIDWRKTLPFLSKTKVLRLKQIAHRRSHAYDGLNTQFLGRRHVRATHRQGGLIGTFTKNTIKKIRKYLRRGVDFITTNNPKECMEEIHRIR